MTLIDAGSLIAGRYRLEERLDSGGRAQVWRATDQELDRPVAVKILLTPEGGDPAFVEAFRAEALLEAGLKHPGIVEVFDWGHDGDANYVVTEFVEGATVRRLIADGPMAPDRVLGLGRQAAGALAYAHAEGVAHGTVGTDHVMVGPDGDATLIDFGLQCRGACEFPAAPDTDTYALGALLYEALVGASPTGPRPANVPDNEPWPEHPHKLNSDIPADLDRVVMKATSPDPANRYKTAAELQAALDELARPKSRAALWIALAVLAVVAAAAAAWFFSSQIKVVVPDVTGTTQAEAQATLQASGFKMVVAGQTPSTDVPAGAVVSENPAAGTKVRSRSEIGVTLSKGKPVATVPSLSGLTLDAASSAIVSAGLAVGSVTNQNNSTFPAGTVISQSPLSGEKLTAGNRVDLVVSAGQAQVTVPEVRGKTRAAASTSLTSLGLVVSVGTVFSTQPTGIVVSQGPTAGSTVTKGSTVTISVSKGPTPVRVPNVVGAQEADADTSLQNIGLVPVSVPTSGTPSQVGNVISQSPQSGTRVRPGSQVRIRVGK